MNKTIIPSKKINLLMLIPVIAFISGFIAFGYMGSFIRIIGDDYFYAAVFKNHGFWGGQIYSYMNHTLFHGNRYTLNFFSHLFTLFPPLINGILPSIIIISFITALYSLFSTAFRRLSIPASSVVLLVMSMIVAFFTLWLAPTVKQGLYWRSSMLPPEFPFLVS